MARYEIFDLETKEVTNVTENFLLLAEWAPIGNALVFVQENNIFYKANVSSDPVQITTDGRENIYNGVCDWVYEEEVFSTKTALWFSPNGAQLAFVRFDDAFVRNMQIPIYGQPGAFQYPEEIIIPYPKTGSPNPTVKLFSVNLKTLEKYENPAPIKLRNIEHIIAVVAWANDDTLLSTWMNRVQNETVVQICENAACKLLNSWVSQTGWIDFFKAPLFNPDGTKYVFLNVTQQTSNSSYRHLTMVSLENGQSKALTAGQFVVLDYLRWDSKNDRIFYLATTEKESYAQHLYLVSTNDNAINRKPVCLTCDIKRNGVPQTYFSATLSPNAERMLLVSEGPSVPRVDIVSIKPSGPIHLEYLHSWEENKHLNGFLETKSVPNIQHLTIPLSSGFDAVVKLHISPYIDLKGTRKYPMLVYVYAGPGSYAGNDRFDLGFGGYASTNRSYIYAEINGRGSGHRSEELMHEIYRKLGTVEISDQIETVT